MNRRAFLTQGTQLLGFALTTGLVPTRSTAQSAARIVVIGGGFGGATSANYLKRFDSNLDVTLVEANQPYFTCPSSNSVIGGLNSYDSIRRDYGGIAKNSVRVVHGLATDIDSDKKLVILSSGERISYDKLIISTGIEFDWNAIEGYTQAVSERIPHAWQAGEQTKLLRSQLESMQDGGVYLLAIPKKPFRAPHAPYERVSLVAHYLSKHKPKSKVLMIDPNASFSNQDLIERAWQGMYGTMLERISGQQVVAIDAKGSEVITNTGEHIRASVLNIVPPQTAGDMCATLGVTNGKGWCDVQAATMHSSTINDIHVLGDACVAGDMPKSASSASSQAKVCAAAIVSEINNTPMPDPVFTSSSYSFIGPKYAVSTAGVYRVINGRITCVAGGESAPRGLTRIAFKEAKFAHGWYAAITADAFGGQ